MTRAPLSWPGNKISRRGRSSVRKWPELKISPDFQTGYNRQTNANNDFPGHDLGSTHTKLKVQSWRKREVLGLQDLREDVQDYGKTVEEGMENIKEVIEMCLQEEHQESLNRFVGFREMEFSTKVA